MARSRRKKSYFQDIIEQPLIVGKKPTTDRAHTMSFRRPFYIAALFWLILIFMFGGVVVAALNFYLDRSMANMKMLGISVAAFFLVWLIGLLQRKTCRCSLCRANSLVDGRSKKHDKAFKIRPLNYSATACFTIVTGNKFRCQHCGTPFVLKNARKTKSS